MTTRFLLTQSQFLSEEADTVLDAVDRLGELLKHRTQIQETMNSLTAETMGAENAQKARAVCREILDALTTMERALSGVVGDIRANLSRSRMLVDEVRHDVDRAQNPMEGDEDHRERLIRLKIGPRSEEVRSSIEEATHVCRTAAEKIRSGANLHEGPLKPQGAPSGGAKRGAQSSAGIARTPDEKVIIKWAEKNGVRSTGTWLIAWRGGDVKRLLSECRRAGFKPGGAKEREAVARWTIARMTGWDSADTLKREQRMMQVIQRMGGSGVSTYEWIAALRRDDASEVRRLWKMSGLSTVQLGVLIGLHASHQAERETDEE